MGFVLGTESEQPIFRDDGVQYVPAGGQHLVDTESVLYRAEAIFGYAVCGQSVRCWPDHAADPAAKDSHFDRACLAGIPQRPKRK